MLRSSRECQGADVYIFPCSEQPVFHSGTQPNASIEPSFAQAQPPLPSQLLLQSFNQIGGSHLRTEFKSNEQDPNVIEFLELVLDENGSCRESDAMSQTQLDVEFDASACIVDNIKTEALQEMETNISAFKTTTSNSAVGYSGNMGFSHNNFGDGAFSVGSTVNQLDNLFNSLEESNSYTNAIGSSDLTGTVIKRRTWQPQIQSDANNCGPQGTARRRIRLQTKLEVGYARGMSRDLNCKGEAEVGQASQSDTGGTTDENQKIEVKKVDQELKMTHIEALSHGPFPIFDFSKIIFF
ncbi:unnamed protein product, partial [Vitis vinifera]